MASPFFSGQDWENALSQAQASVSADGRAGIKYPVLVESESDKQTDYIDSYWHTYVFQSIIVGLEPDPARDTDRFGIGIYF